MPKRKIYLVSPREPSGATWLINCLLELGIMTYRYSPAGMWRNETGRWFLNSPEHILRKWLPALVDHSSFQFRDDLEVQWMHEWFTDAYADNDILYFVRDPRDALFSRFKREAPQLSFREFAAFPDVYTLLDKVANWWLYNKTWLAHPRVTVFRFEDYKSDADKTLASVLAALRLQYSDADISRATRCSTFERAAAAERAYRAEHSEDTQLINRSGRPMEWEAGEIDGSVVVHIENTCADLLAHYGYASSAADPGSLSLARHLPRLAFFSTLEGLQEAAKLERIGSHYQDASAGVMALVASLDPTLLRRTRLPEYELRQLQSSLREYLESLGHEVEACFSQAMPAAAPPDREVMPLARMRRGLWKRLRRVLGAGA